MCGLGGAGGHAAGRRHRDVRAELGRPRRADTGMDRCAPWAQPRSARRERLHDRWCDRRDRHARLLAAIQSTDGGEVTTAISSNAGLGPVPEYFDRHTVEQFLYREARLADESDYDG